MATCCENDVIGHVLPFVQSNIVSTDWKLRDAAAMAFGRKLLTLLLFLLLSLPSTPARPHPSLFLPFPCPYCVLDLLIVSLISSHSIPRSGSILEGPDPDTLSPLCAQAMPLFVNLLKDDSVVVRDTAAWTIGRLCEIMPEVIYRCSMRQMYETIIFCERIRLSIFLCYIVILQYCPSLSCRWSSTSNGWCRF